MSVDAKPKITGGNFALWIGMIGGPAAWLVQFQLSYMLVPWACHTGHHLPLHLSGILFFLVSVAIAWMSWRHLLTFKTEPNPALAREHFMALLGVMLSVLFSLVIFVQIAAAFIIGPCPE